MLWVIFHHLHCVNYRGLLAEKTQSRKVSTVYGVTARIHLVRGDINNFRNGRCHLYRSCSSAMQRYMIVLAYIESQCTKFHAAELTCWFFTSSYMRSCIWPDAISWLIRQTNSVRFCANLGKSETESLAVITQAFGEESMSRTQVFKLHARFRADRKRRDR
jgi:hypothetical protein